MMVPAPEETLDPATLFGELCDSSIALAAGVFARDGTARYLNRGMRLLLDGIATARAPSEIFVNPTLEALWEATRDGQRFAGVLTASDGARLHRSLSGQAWRHADLLLVAGEMDLLELERLNQVLIGANHEITDLQRKLVKQNRLLAGHVESLERQTRLYQGFHEIHHAILHQRDEQSLLDRLCEIAVQQIDLLLAWVGFPSQAGWIEPHAAAGRTQYLRDLRIQIDPNTPEGHGPTAEAYRTGTRQIVDDFLAAPSTSPWHLKAREHGIAASGAFPLCNAWGVMGVLSVYSNRVGFFGPEELRLLDRLATDLAIAIETSRQAKALFEIESRFNVSEERLKLAVEAAGMGVWEYGISSDTLVWDAGMYRLHDRQPDATIRTLAAWRALVHPDDRETLDETLALAIAGLAPFVVDLRVLDTRGERRDLRLHGRLFEGTARDSARLMGIAFDVTDQKHAVARIQALAFRDPLTRLANRQLLMERIEQAQACSERNGDHSVLILLDIDHFKELNDTRGHDIGDALLIEVANRLRDILREMDTAARLGGDEFVILCEGLHMTPELAAREALAIGEKIAKCLQRPYRFEGEANEAKCSVSLGITLFRGRASSASQLLKQADIAMYQSKRDGRGLLRLYQPEMQRALEDQARRERALRQAVADGHLALAYQPQVDADGRWFGCEALLRWTPRDGTILSPAQFLPQTQGSNVMAAIGDWVLQTVCGEIGSLFNGARPELLADFVVGLNLNARQLIEPHLLERILEITERLDFAPSRLRLEITEATLFSNLERFAPLVTRLGRAGIGVELDDFGTGRSSLLDLSRLPLKAVKIDQNLIASLDREPEVVAIVRAAIGVARSMSLEVIAEGVERETQHRLLLDLGCNRFQGFLFGRPMPFEALQRALLTGPTTDSSLDGV